MTHQHKGALASAEAQQLFPQHSPVPGSGGTQAESVACSQGLWKALQGVLHDSVPEMCQSSVASLLKPPGLSALSWGCYALKKQGKNSLSYPEISSLFQAHIS